VIVEDPATLAEREDVARAFAEQFKVSLPILVDTIDNKVEQAYTAMPDRIYVIDADGKIAYKGGPGPSGFQAADVPPVLDRLLGLNLARQLNLPAGPLVDGGGQPGRERMRAMLLTAGLDDKDAQQALKALEQRMEAYRPVLKARMALLQQARAGAEIAAALKSYDEAAKEYAAAAARIDGALDEAINYRQRPTVHAVLTGLGLVGNQPAPPYAELPGMGAGSFKKK
jgi:hypothetical protein